MVAGRAAAARLPLWVTAKPEGKSDRRARKPAMVPTLRKSGSASVLVLALAGFHPDPSSQANPIARFRVDRHDRLITEAIARLDGTGRLKRSRETVAMTLVV